MIRPQQVYERRRQAYEKLREKQQRAADRLSNARLYTSVVGLALAVVLYRVFSLATGVAAGLLALILFVYLARRHQRIRRQLVHTEALRGINQKGIERATGEWGAFADTGADFREDDHPFASDLDLFGRASLFQWINSAQTALGRATLARVLKQAPADCAEILARQEAVTELAGKLAWRQRFETEGLLADDRLEPAGPLVQWAAETHESYLQPWVKVGVRVLPAVTIVLGALYLFLHAVPWQVPTFFLVVQGILLRVHGKERARVLTMVYRYEARLRTYARMLDLLEHQKFHAPWLRLRQEKLRDAGGRSACRQIDRLSKIAERITNRENAMFLLVNLLTLWDYQCMIALGEWKNESGMRLGNWLKVLAEFEALSSLANIRFEHPDWAFPTVVPTDTGGLSAQQLGHPLITQNRVSNDFAMRAPSQVAVLTGSNMSGKSTFLRTVGINLVLAYAGAPVCAERLSCSLMSLWTSMRTADNLEQSISSFYAEILRIKRIVDAARSGKRVCFLLDEVFKGTNSRDRHQGAKALVAELQKDGAFGLISTHDLELGELERESGGRIKNYHFREHYEGGEIRFDYTLRSGVSTTRNALYLIKLMGIELEEA